MVQADETLVTFDLDVDFLENDIELNEINTDEISDDILANVGLDLPAVQNDIMPKEATPEGRTIQNKGKRFEVVSPEQIDEIAASNHAKKTKRQTAWSVNIFRGK